MLRVKGGTREEVEGFKSGVRILRGGIPLPFQSCGPPLPPPSRPRLDPPSSSLGLTLTTATMRITVLNRPLFDSFFAIMDIKQGEELPPHRDHSPFLSRSPSIHSLVFTIPSHRSRCYACRPLWCPYIRINPSTPTVSRLTLSDIRDASPPTRPLPHPASRQILNKVAGVYGLLGAFFAGGSFSQLSYYLYSTLSLAAFIFGLRAISDERTSEVLRFAHFYLFDHLLGTMYTLVFAINWWLYVSHDGQRLVNGDAQKAMIELAISRNEVAGEELSAEERAKIALALWSSEKLFAVLVLLSCWILKVGSIFLPEAASVGGPRGSEVRRAASSSWATSAQHVRELDNLSFPIQIYFSLSLYSFAAHLRQNTYRALPLTTTPLAPHSSHAVSMESQSKQSSRQLKSSELHGEEEFKWDSDDEGEGREGRAERGLAST